MTISQVILVVIAVLAVVAIAVLAVAVGKRNAQRRRDRAEQLRSDAARQSPAVAESLRIAEESGVRARLARLEAERAQEDAERARTAALMNQARQEDVLREADLVDPDRDPDRGAEIDGPDDEARFGLQRSDPQTGAA